MKKFIILFSILLISSTLMAQLKPKAAVSYDLTSLVKLSDPLGNTLTYHMPKFNFRTGLEYSYNKLSVYYDMKFWCSFSKDSFLPEEASFEVGIKYNINDKIKIIVNHTCYHPLDTEHHLQNKLFGGHQGITISYGY